MSAGELQQTDAYVIHLLNRVVEQAIIYLQGQDEQSLKLHERSRLLALLNSIQIALPTSVHALKKNYVIPESLEHLDAFEDTAPDKEALLEYMKAAQTLCKTLQTNGFRSKEVRLYNTAIDKVINLVNSTSPPNEHLATFS